MDPFALLLLAVCFMCGKWRKHYWLFNVGLLAYCLFVYAVASFMVAKAGMGAASPMAAIALFIIGNAAYGAGRIANRFWPSEK